MCDELLHVEHGLSALDRAKRSPGKLRIGHAEHAEAFGAKDRLHHDIAAQTFKCFESGIGVLAHDRFRHLKARGGQSHECEVLINANLERSRRVQDRDAPCLQRVQQVHAKDHLL